MDKKQATERLLVFGAANRIRTGDLVLTKDVLYLLSHSSVLHNYNIFFQFVKRFLRYF